MGAKDPEVLVGYCSQDRWSEQTDGICAREDDCLPLNKLPGGTGKEDDYPPS